ncbi:MAG: FHA domain-containing protein [Sedimentisphaerales bacterium]|nr:FHA domain-containing protein [Sedimentisphaerales bacterium]
MQANLVLLKSDGSHKAFELPSTVTVVGRRHDCDLRIPLPMVSRRHFQLSQNGETLKIRDLESKTGTFVNDRRVNGDTAVKAGDYIRVGPVMFVCQIDGQPTEIKPPQKKAPPKPKAPPAQASKPADPLEDSFADLDASDSFIGLDEDDADLEDLKDL